MLIARNNCRALLAASLLALLLVSNVVALDLRPTVSPFIQNDTDVFMRVQRNMCVGTATPLDALSICTAPVASATRALVNLSNTALSAGSASGTYLGANPSSCAGDFLNLQLADAARARLTCAGALTVVSSTNNLSIFSATTSAQLAGVLSNETGTNLVVFNTSPTITSPIITNIAPGANFTLTQNSVAVLTSVEVGALVNTLYLTSGNVVMGAATATAIAAVSKLAVITPNNGFADIGLENNNTGATTGVRFASYSVSDGFKKGAIAFKDRADGTQRGDLYFSLENTAGATNVNVVNDAKFVIFRTGSAGLGTVSPATGADPSFAIGQSSNNPTGMGANLAGILVKDVAGTAELFGFDEAGNIPQLTPHPTNFLNTLPLEGRPYPWAHSSENAYLGKSIQVDMAGVVAEVERLSGKKFAYVTDIAKQDWAANQAALVVAQEKKIVDFTAYAEVLTAKISAERDAEKKATLLEEYGKLVKPKLYIPEAMPLWMRQRLSN